MSRTFIYYGGCWPTNIGNAFIDLGSLHSLKLAFPDDCVVFASEFNKSFFNSHKLMGRAMSIIEQIECDYLVVSGMN